MKRERKENLTQNFQAGTIRAFLSHAIALPVLVLITISITAFAQTPTLNGDWAGYFPDGTKSTYVWRISQSGVTLNFLDVGAGTNTKFSGQLSGNTITDSNKKTGTISADSMQIRWSDGVIWKRQGAPPPVSKTLFPDGAKINLFADNGYRMTRCNGCQDTLNNSLPDTIILGSDVRTEFSTFVVKNDPAATGKIMLEADNGKKFTYCNGCITGGALYAEQLVLEVSGSDYLYNKFELAKLSNGKYTLKAPNGKYLARCDGCSPSLQRRTKSNNGNVVMAHITDPNSIYSQWTITLPGQTEPTPKDDFSLIFASDPQYGYCDPPRCNSKSEDEGLKRSLEFNESHLRSIKTQAATLNQFKGVVINGDLTNTIRDDQRDYFWKNYVLGIRTYPGLGNHDYVNGLRGYASGRLPLMMAKFAQWVTELSDTQDFDWKVSGNRYKGSLSYWWDIGTYRFVQLNFHPAYVENFSSGGNDYNFTHSMDWLKSVLDKSNGQTVILNMHGINTGDSFSATSGTAGWGYALLQKLLDSYPNVKTIFAGHIHQWAGDKAYYDNGTVANDPNQGKVRLGSLAEFSTQNGRKIPVLFNGSAIFNLYMSVRFERDKFTWTVIDSRNGGVSSLDSGTVIVR